MFQKTLAENPQDTFMLSVFPVLKQRNKENVQHRIQYKNDMLTDPLQYYRVAPTNCSQTYNSAVNGAWWGRVGGSQGTVLILAIFA